MENAEVSTGTIVVGIDGSDGSTHALQWAIEQGRLEHRPLTLVHGCGPATSGWMNQPGIDYVTVVDAMRAEGRLVLEDARASVSRRAPDVTVATFLDLVDPRTLLLKLSGSAAMVVVGSRGRGPLVSTLLGSVSVAVAQEATCPVAIARPGHAGLVRTGVLVGVDGTERSQSALEFAFLQASQRSLPLTVLHSFWDAAPTASGGREVEADETGYDDLRALVSEATSGMREKFPDVHVQVKLVRGLADDNLARASQGMHMVVVGAHARRWLPAFFGGQVDREVIEHATCMVAVVPGGP